MTTGARGPDVTVLAGVAAGGAAGSLGRWGVGLSLPPTPGGFPWATFLVNVTGALAMGLLVAVLVERPGTHRLVRPVVGVGLLGGWTTFSALAVDAVTLGDSGRLGVAALYLAATVVVGVLAVVGGLRLGRTLWAGP
ncbi:CrcB family protein [Phycicoccus sp. BSK3Z-2]|uniref:Fluoride-specific ion channel FluC n=1 Tax=Phycicoccus avicenniae TaxID=2828860 RepID=A0A941HYZ9_9MICO|nr:CrcB family protein [Phycicoccus avicenniae]MBR7741726.1 CrcB family protein [Phycicoccus avicenniae]